MGNGLPKPVMIKHLERCCNRVVVAGSCSVNGHRESMEDAHVMFRGVSGQQFFAICDGHGGFEAANFVSQKWPEILGSRWNEGTLPSAADAAQWATTLDAELIEKRHQSGCTCTAVFVAAGAADGQSTSAVPVRIMNIGDSRTIVCSNGEVIAASVDHSPDRPDEKARVERSKNGFVAGKRVNGVLAVSRAFGDYEFKDGAPNDSPVIAIPEFVDSFLGTGPADFIALVCDGVFENAFDTETLALFVTTELRERHARDEYPVDAAAVAALVCEEAVRRGSKDNVSCMIITRTPPSRVAGALVVDPTLEVVPGPFNASYHQGFRDAYESMCLMGGMSVGKVLEERFDHLLSEVRRDGSQQDLADELDGDFEQMKATVTQLLPPHATQEERANRTQLFAAWFQRLSRKLTTDTMPIFQSAGGGSGGGGGGHGGSPPPPGGGGDGGGDDAFSPGPFLGGYSGPPRVEQTPEPSSLRPPPGSPYSDSNSVGNVNNLDSSGYANSVAESVTETIARMQETLRRSQATSAAVAQSMAEHAKLDEAWKKFEGAFDKINAALANNLERMGGFGHRGTSLGLTSAESRLTVEQRAAVFNGKPPSIEAIAEMIKKGAIRNIVVACGAGISCSAGIPDFRSKDTGLYAQLRREQEEQQSAAVEAAAPSSADDAALTRARRDWDLGRPEDLFDIDFFMENPMPFINRAATLWPGEGCEFRPTPAHGFIRLLHERLGALRVVLTQNIDGLETVAGIPDKLVEQCHGSFGGVACPRCHYRIPKFTADGSHSNPEYISARRAMCEEKVPAPCPQCSAPLKPDIVFFGEQLPRSFAHRVDTDLPQCDLLIVMGTSLKVEPFSSVPDHVPPTCPRLLLNNELVEAFARTVGTPGNYRDVAVLGNVDDSCFMLAEMLGFKSELQRLCRDELRCRVVASSSSPTSSQRKPVLPAGRKSPAPPGGQPTPKHAVRRGAPPMPAAATTSTTKAGAPTPLRTRSTSNTRKREPSPVKR